MYDASASENDTDICTRRSNAGVRGGSSWAGDVDMPAVDHTILYIISPAGFQRSTVGRDVPSVYRCVTMTLIAK